MPLRYPLFLTLLRRDGWGIVPVDRRVSINPGKGIIVIFQHSRDDLSLSIAGQEVNSSWRGAGIKKAVT
ncbi:hypothetical protein [Klebsiella quasipneumoniae]|uniref:hypothetical protein n=1 Tax=Klebsiella quasipneumoniae TaxID=1463165 RepID=UPI000CFDFB79|nr:hypothetical protein [Klebsiella quasipneumoniae]PQM80815.1 hypothetical protein C5672_00435 [Klebsiella quasipneumoniae]PQM91328.1 hypothetical protein C5673_00435 [Klebsiella quasipneumoniae]